MRNNRVRRAIDRWESAGLLDADVAAGLRAEQDDSSRRGRRRLSHYAVAATAGVLLLVAAATFLAWSWPRMGEGARAGLIWATGIAVLGLGLRWGGRAAAGSDAGADTGDEVPAPVEADSVWRRFPVTSALQSTGLLLMLAAYAYSFNAWPAGTAAGILVGVLSLATPIALLVAPARGSPFMFAATVASGYGFAAVFLHRALSLSGDGIVWALDGLLLANIVGMAVWLGVRSPRRRSTRAVLNAFVVSVYAGFVLVFLTAFVALELGDDSVLAFDAWLVLVTALAIWGIHGAPPGLASPRHVGHVAFSVALAVPFGFATTRGVYDLPPPVAALVVGGVGIAGLWYGLRRGAMSLIVASCAAVVCAAWYLGADYGDRLGSVVALAVVAVAFFVGAGRMVRRGEGGDGPSGS